MPRNMLQHCTEVHNTTVYSVKSGSEIVSLPLKDNQGVFYKQAWELTSVRERQENIDTWEGTITGHTTYLLHLL